MVKRNFDKQVVRVTTFDGAMRKHGSYRAERLPPDYQDAQAAHVGRAAPCNARGFVLRKRVAL